MSSRQAPRQRKEPAPEPRAPLFEVRDTPLPRPPRPIETVLGDVDDLPDGSRRAARRAPPELRTVEPEPTPAVAAAQQAPQAAVRPAASQAQQSSRTTASPAFTEAPRSYPSRPEFARPMRERPAPYESYPHWAAPVGQAGSRTLVLLLVALACGVVIWMFLQSPKTYISRYGAPGWSDAAGDAARKAFGAIDVAAGEHSVLGEPTITAAAIDTILAKYGSPAVGTGQTWVTLGQRYGIDPAYAVAFFIHESSAGTNPGWAGIKPDGTTTHNVGNIICAGYTTCYQGHRDYESWEAGIEAWYRLIANEYVEGRGLGTVEQILPIYCPTSDGCSPDTYIQIVNTMVDQWRQHKLSR